jgi:hypothetical protein
MRVGVIRGDIPGPLAINDLETVSQYNPTTEPRGQERRIGRPNVAGITALLVNLGLSANVVDLITATLPVGGPLDISASTIRGVSGLGSATDAQVAAIADAIAPHFIETDVAIKSFQVGMISGFRSAFYNPDPRRFPAISNGAAISVVQDDGITPFVAPMTVISGAVHDSPNAGDITISGTNLGNSEVLSSVVRVYSADMSRSVKLLQKVVQTTFTNGTQGLVSATSIRLPASLLAGLGVAGSKVVVQYTSLVSNMFTVT